MCIQESWEDSVGPLPLFLLSLTTSLLLEFKKSNALVSIKRQIILEGKMFMLSSFFFFFSFLNKSVHCGCPVSILPIVYLAYEGR